MLMKLAKLALLLFILIGQAISTANDIPDGTKLYCKEVLFESFDEEGFVRERINSNIRELFIIGDTKIYHMNSYSFFEYNIEYKLSHKTAAKHPTSGDTIKLIYFHELESIKKQIWFSDSLSRHYFDYNCSKNKNIMY